MNDGAIAQVFRTGLVARGSSGFKDSSGLFLSCLCFTSLSSPSGSPSETLEAGRAVTRAHLSPGTHRRARASSLPGSVAGKGS